MDVETDVDDSNQQEQTDVESVTSTGNSTVTQLPQSSSETELDFGDFDESITEGLLESQFLGTFRKEERTASKEGVQEWLTANGDDETQDAQSLDSIRAQFFDTSFDENEIEKTAAELLDALKTDSFNAIAWAEVDQQVPTGNLKSNFIKEARERPVLTLMNFIKIYCSDTDNISDNLYYKIIKYATQSIQQTPELDNEFVEKRKPVDFETLKNFAWYFEDLRLRIFKCPKNKRVFVSAVETFVSAEIADAAQANNAVLFTRYSSIPEVVEKCNNEKRLNFSPEQLAKYGLHLQKAVNQEIIYRCLAFLKHIGYPLTADDDDREENRLNLSSNEVFLSQGSQQDEVESCHSQNSQRSDMSEVGQYLQANRNFALEAAIYDAQNSPGFIEVLRGYNNLRDDNSPGGSQRSMYSYESHSQSPPAYSLPEREPEGASEPTNNQVADEVNFMDEFVIINHEEIQRPESASDGSQSSLDSGEPLRRRPRWE